MSDDNTVTDFAAMEIRAAIEGALRHVGTLLGGTIDPGTPVAACEHLDGTAHICPGCEVILCPACAHRHLTEHLPITCYACGAIDTSDTHTPFQIDVVAQHPILVELVPSGEHVLWIGDLNTFPLAWECRRCRGGLSGSVAFVWSPRTAA